MKCAEFLELLLFYESLDSLPFYEDKLEYFNKWAKVTTELRMREQDNVKLGLCLAFSLPTV